MFVWQAKTSTSIVGVFITRVEKGKRDVFEVGDGDTL
jgi:hypothetical protein